jgi:hypothetical protein
MATFNARDKTPMGLDDGGGGEADPMHVAIQLLDVLGLEAVEPVMPDAGNELVHNELAVADQRRRAHLARCDRLQPVLEPLPNRGRLAGRTRGSGIALPFQFANLGHNIAAPHA